MKTPGLLILRFLLLLFSAGLIACANGSKPVPADAPENILPADTVLYFSIPDVPASRDRWNQSAMGRAWQDPALAFWRAEKLDPALRQLLAPYGLEELPALLDLVQGRATLAITLPGADAQNTINPRPALHAILDFADDAESARALIARNWESIGQKELPAGARLPALDLHRAPLGAAIAAAWEGPRLHLSNHPDALARLLGPQPPERLADSPFWKKTADADPQADANGFLRADLLHDRLLPAARAGLALPGGLLEPEQLTALTQWLGLDAVETYSVSVRVQGEGYYQRRGLSLRGEPRGYLFAPRGDAPLVTPQWATTRLKAFSAMRIQSPLALASELRALTNSLQPASGQAWDNIDMRLRSELDLTLDELLAGLGSEFATLDSGSGQIAGSTVLLWEIADPRKLETALAAIQRRFALLSESHDYEGQSYRQLRWPGAPLALFTANVDGFLMLAGSDAWLKRHVDLQQQIASDPSLAPPGKPAGPDSLLPLLQEPFPPLPDDALVEARSYANPLAELSQLTALLPMAIPMLNIQLQGAGLDPIPPWVVGSLPPFLPFARESFPSVSRSARLPGGSLRKETYSPMDPLATPFLATGVVLLAEMQSAANAE